MFFHNPISLNDRAAHPSDRKNDETSDPRSRKIYLIARLCLQKNSLQLIFFLSLKEYVNIIKGLYCFYYRIFPLLILAYLALWVPKAPQRQDFIPTEPAGIFYDPGTLIIMETANLILGNTLLLAAILLFLAILPRALRQTKKTALDKAVEKFEKEELKAEMEGKSKENIARPKKLSSQKDSSLAYLADDIPSSSETSDYMGIPPFPAQEDENEENIKIVKEGFPISHSDSTDPPPVPRKKTKLIKQEISIAPDKKRLSSKKSSPDPQKYKNSAKDQKSTLGKELHAPPIIENRNEEFDDNWIEAEIPGLTLEPPHPVEKSDSIPTFKASSGEKHAPGIEKTKKSSEIEKQDMNVKSLAPETEEEKGSKPNSQIKAKTGPAELEIEISESDPNAVEKNAGIVSHKSIKRKKVGQKKSKQLPSKAGRTRETEAEGAAVLSQPQDLKTFPEKAKPKPFLLDLKYLDREDQEIEKSTDSKETLSPDMVDKVIARLNDLQVDLEKQLISIPGELIPNDGATNGSSDQEDGLLEELDSFLFTATQRKKTE